PKPRSSMFSSLKIRNYRLFFTGQVVSNTGTWTQVAQTQVAQISVGAWNVPRPEVRSRSSQ
ncbi:hypothetical protein AB0H92_29040, partial [Streptomyces phaeochromogenes]|uniref:hypothetical protein n=1 Tax=Streptomyces phaeochromogenes TaxID=1923 RepID=UPI0033C6019F